jgi:ATP-binding cassette subfamily B protein/subfamily B ATP-binding cassette protein MsbA
MRLWRQILTFYRADWLRVGAALGLLLATTAVAIFKPWPLAWIVDRLARNDAAATGAGDDLRVILGWAALLAAVHGLHALLGAAQQALVIHTGLRGLARVRRAVFGWLLRLSLRRLQGAQAGDLIYRATWDTHAFQTLFQQGLFTFLGATLTLVAMTVVMWRFNPALTLVALGTVPVLLLIMRFFGPLMSQRAGRAQAADSGVAALVQQAVANLPLIQGFTREQTEADRFEASAAGSLAARWRQHRAEVVYLAVVAVVFAVGTAGIVVLGAREVTAGNLTVGRLLVFLAYLAQLYEPLNQLSHVGSTVSNARAGAERVLELLAEDRATKAEPMLKNRTFPAAELAFEDVSFAYTTGQPVLRNVRVSLRAGESVALIGPSGAGKTTLLQMIPRFLDPDSGVVRLAGEDLRSYPRPWLREHVALVLQESLLLPTTIAENIGYGRAGATRDEIEAAAAAANAHEFIRRLPQGYDTVVGDGAARLSVGEKQRLNLARAFLKDAPILLLDEPTSALDAESEGLVLASLRRLMKGRTTLMVAHRLATIREVDRIVVLNAGEVMEVGTAAELLAKGGYFSRVNGS